MCDYRYCYELDDNVPRASQPQLISVSLKAHQLACLQKSISMEKNGKIYYDMKEENTSNLRKNFEIKSNVGIIGDIVGYGKTLTALSIIASNKLDDIHTNKEMLVSYCNNKNYNYLTYSTDNPNIIDDNKIINSTLIIVPRGPVYNQWLDTIKNNTSLKYLAIENLNYIKKNLPECKNNSYQDVIEYFNQYDLVLIKNTTFDVLLSYYPNIGVDEISKLSFIKRWKRIIIDEAHDIATRIPLMYYKYLWLISGTYQNILQCNRPSYNSILYPIKDAINYNTLNMILVKCTKEFVRKSFKLPIPIEKYYICKMAANLNIIRNFINTSVLEKINANDISGAIKDLGGKSETENNLIDLVSKELKRDLLNKEKEKEYINSLDIPEDSKTNRIKTIDTEISILKNKIEDLTSRITELNSKTCPICMCLMEHPIVLECTHSYCASCIMLWISSKCNCPECRKPINVNKMTAVINNLNNNTENEIINQKTLQKTKEETLINIIKENPNGKYLIFSKHDSHSVSHNLLNNNIDYAELKGNTAHMTNILEKFKNGSLKVILLNTNFAGSGIDISYATDIILYHNLGTAKHQAIGRAQRVGRTEPLNIHYIYYEHEMENK
jgi:superfamily II DNA or RNA helicase